jgi:hypothetical protein
VYAGRFYRFREPAAARGERVEEVPPNGWRNQRITTKFIRPSFKGRTV